MIPYIKETMKNLDSLKAVLIGPKNNSDIAEKGLKCFFRNQKMNIEIQKIKDSFEILKEKIICSHLPKIPLNKPS